MGASRPGPLRRLQGVARDVAARVERRAARRFGDLELQQLRALERAYGRKRGPELLVIGHSQLFYRGRNEPDTRPVVEMLRDELGGRVKILSLGGPGYNQRLTAAYLSALPDLRSRPEAVIVTIHPVLAGPMWYDSPRLGYEKAAEGIRAAIAAGRDRPRRLEKPSAEDWDRYDRRPAPSLIGARRTMGELTLMVNSRPTTRYQQEVRLRHRVDFYYADHLEPDDPGVRMSAEVGRMLKEMGIPSIALLSAINYEAAVRMVGDGVVDHIRRNGQIVEQAYQDAVGDTGTVLNCCFDCRDEEFSDPLHHKQDARLRLARQLAAVVRPHLEQPAPSPAPVAIATS